MAEIANPAGPTAEDRRMAIRIDPERAAMFDRVRMHLSPHRPHAVSLTAVLLYCIERTYQVDCLDKDGK